MPNTYYNSDLTGEQIEAALNAIHGVVTPENNGKVLAIESGKIITKSASEWADTPVLEPITITQNGTTTPPTGVDGFNSVTVNVQGGGSEAVVQPLTVTENGTYNPPSGVDGFAPVIVNVSGGGGYIESWDLTDSLVGDLRGIPMSANNVSLSASGAVFNSIDSRLNIPFGGSGIYIEIDVASMSLRPGSHRRFIMATYDNGLIYRSSGVWAFYTNTWVESAETDGSFFDGSTIRVYIDVDGYWHIYKDGVLWWEPSLALKISSSWNLGSSQGNSINNVVISGVRLM